MDSHCPGCLKESMDLPDATELKRKKDTRFAIWYLRIRDA